jgi:hypothetical protein
MTPCPSCHGERYRTEMIKNLGTLNYRESMEPCSMCSATGMVTEQDHHRYLHSIGIAPHK